MLRLRAHRALALKARRLRSTLGSSEKLTKREEPGSKAPTTTPQVPTQPTLSRIQVPNRGDSQLLLLLLFFFAPSAANCQGDPIAKLCGRRGVRLKGDACFIHSRTGLGTQGSGKAYVGVAVLVPHPGAAASPLVVGRLEPVARGGYAREFRAPGADSVAGVGSRRHRHVRRRKLPSLGPLLVFFPFTSWISNYELMVRSFRTIGSRFIPFTQLLCDGVAVPVALCVQTPNPQTFHHYTSFFFFCFW